MQRYYDGKVVLVVGASLGIGKEIALQLARCNANLVLCARGVDALSKVKEECLKLSSKQRDVLTLKCDISVEAECKAMVAAAVEHFKRIDVLILNAGVSGSIPFLENKDLAIYKKMLNINFLGFVNVTFHAMPHLLASRGRIGVMSSASGLLGVPFRTAYCASKFAVNGFFEALRTEVADRVQISMVCPGWVNSDIRTRHVVEHSTAVQSYSKSKMISVEDCAAAMLNAVATGKRLEAFNAKTTYLMPLMKVIAPHLVDRYIVGHVQDNSKSNSFRDLFFFLRFVWKPTPVVAKTASSNTNTTSSIPSRL